MHGERIGFVWEFLMEGWIEISLASSSQNSASLWGGRFKKKLSIEKKRICSLKTLPPPSTTHDKKFMVNILTWEGGRRWLGAGTPAAGTAGPGWGRPRTLRPPEAPPGEVASINLERTFGSLKLIFTNTQSKNQAGWYQECAMDSWFLWNLVHICNVLEINPKKWCV